MKRLSALPFCLALLAFSQASPSNHAQPLAAADAALLTRAIEAPPTDVEQAQSLRERVPPVFRASRSGRRTQPTIAPAPRVRSSVGAYHGSAGSSINGYPCGGDLPPCWVLARESGGNPRAVNSTGCGGRGCYGLWQFDPLTWNHYGGVYRASDAPASVQNEKARLTWAGGRGCGNWGAC